jgi:hypothetical protein
MGPEPRHDAELPDSKYNGSLTPLARERIHDHTQPQE